jgi:hypothetical protein
MPRDLPVEEHLKKFVRHAQLRNGVAGMTKQSNQGRTLDVRSPLLGSSGEIL